MCFFHTYVLDKYCKDNITIIYLFSVHFLKHHGNFGKHGDLVQNSRVKVNRSRPTCFVATQCLRFIKTHYSGCYSISG